MERFDWQTEEDGPITPASVPLANRTRGRLIAVLIVILLVAVAAVIAWQLRRQAQQHEQAIRQDVQAAFDVWQKAVARRDSDLLDTLLIDGEAAWTATQRELLASGRALDRSGVGFSLAESGPDALVIEAEIDVSSDWRSAEIKFPVTYAPRWEDGQAQEVRLEQTVSLVRDGSRWLLRRPREAFWGIWHTQAGKIATVTFRERDSEVAERFLDDLDRDLGSVCAGEAGRDSCQATERLNVRLESDAAVLLKDIDRERPVFAGRTFVLPSPTLVGNPLDETGYEALYRAYARPILSTFEASLASPVSLPEQIASMICFNRYGNLPRLFIYDPAADLWTAEIEDSAFRFLAASDDDQRIALRQHLPREPYRLRIVQWSQGQATVLHDETYGPLTDHSLGWVETAGEVGLLLSEYQGTTRRPAYHLIRTDGDNAFCPDTGCPLQTLDGFPSWSPDGARSLVQIEGRLYLADADGQAEVDLGPGHDPFWLDGGRFGFIRPPADEQRQFEEVMIGAVDGSGLAVAWTTAALDLSLLGSGTDSPFYVQHVAFGGEEDSRLLLYGRQYAGDDSRYAVYSLPLDGDSDLAGPARLELVLDRTPARLPSATDPNGHAPFVLSSDGRWLTAAHLADDGTDLWIIEVVEIGRDNALHFSVGYPGYSFNQPFLDWSADGRWLLIVDEGFLRLVAPEAGFERIVAHDQRNCSYPAWLDR